MNKTNVYSIPKSGGAPFEIAHDQFPVTHMAVNSTHVFWLGFGGAKRAPK